PAAGSRRPEGMCVSIAPLPHLDRPHLTPMEGAPAAPAATTGTSAGHVPATPGVDDGPDYGCEGGAEMVQLLTPEGRLRPHPRYAAVTDPQTLRDMYRDMVLVRRFDAEATALQRQGELGL